MIDATRAGVEFYATYERGEDISSHMEKQVKEYKAGGERWNSEI